MRYYRRQLLERATNGCLGLVGGDVGRLRCEVTFYTVGLLSYGSRSYSSALLCGSSFYFEFSIAQVTDGKAISAVLELDTQRCSGSADDAAPEHDCCWSRANCFVYILFPGGCRVDGDSVKAIERQRQRLDYY
jgi:hypothetical protein